jgi:hypothetical protein
LDAIDVVFVLGLCSGECVSKGVVDEVMVEGGESLDVVSGGGAV